MNEQDIINILFLVYSCWISLNIFSAYGKLRSLRKFKEKADSRKKTLKPMYGKFVK